MLALLASLLLVGASSSRRHLSAWQQQQQQQRPIDGAHFLGFNVVNLQSGNFSTDSAYVRTTAAQLHAGTLRYPGGNLGDWWDWKTGWCPPPPLLPPVDARHRNHDASFWRWSDVRYTTRCAAGVWTTPQSRPCLQCATRAMVSADTVAGRRMLGVHGGI
jgi:hypothetical protein